VVEKLFVYALLLSVGFESKSDYGEYLDMLFMETPDDDLLLELEWMFSDTQKSVSTILQHCNNCKIDYDVFGAFLCEKLKDIYLQLDIAELVQKLMPFGKSSQAQYI